MHPAQLTFPQSPAITAAACPRQLAMVYDQSPTDLAFALLPVFATLWSEQVSADGTEMLPAAAMEELMARVVAAVIITKDQLLNLAAELLPPGRMRELLRVPIATGRIRGVAADKTQKTTPPDRHFDQLPLVCSAGPGQSPGGSHITAPLRPHHADEGDSHYCIHLQIS